MLIDKLLRNNVLLVKALLKVGADKQLAAKNGMRTIDFASECGRKNMLERQDRMIYVKTCNVDSQFTFNFMG